MGNFYTNITLRRTNQKTVVASLKGRRTFVSPESNSCVVVFDEECESQDPNVLSKLSSRLSKSLGCTALAVLNHDDDILLYHLYDRGDLRDEYNSSPGYFDGDPSDPPSGGNPDALCAAMGSSQRDEVSRVLQADLETYAFAFERHADLVRALGLPEWAVAAGFNYLSEGELPEGLEETTLVSTE
jgi:hypothetical protein